MPEVTQQQVVDYIKGISVLELSQLVKTLESELGVSAATAMPMAMPMAGAGGGKGQIPAQRHPVLDDGAWCADRHDAHRRRREALTSVKD